MKEIRVETPFFFKSNGEMRKFENVKMRKCENWKMKKAATGFIFFL
jgi:hypothetical protein